EMVDAIHFQGGAAFVPELIVPRPGMAGRDHRLIVSIDYLENDKSTSATGGNATCIEAQQGERESSLHRSQARLLVPPLFPLAAKRSPLVHERQHLIDLAVPAVAPHQLRPRLRQPLPPLGAVHQLLQRFAE